MSSDLPRDPIEDGFVCIVWPELDNLTKIEPKRSAFKGLLRARIPHMKDGAIPIHAGTLFRFLHEMEVGHYVLYPSKSDRIVHIGQISGDYDYDQSVSSTTADDITQHRRPVKWLNSFPRTTFSQSALYEIGSATTLIDVKKHKSEFLSTLAGKKEASINPANVDDIETERNSDVVRENTEDFVIRKLNAIEPREFEYFVAHLLKCMGYYTRVTQFVGDGGVDVIAHKDRLGFEPPIIKVQCKKTENTIGRPDVQRLLGATEEGEYSLFITLGGYSKEAIDAERSKTKLRLIDGSTLTSLIFEHYAKFELKWKEVIPLEQGYVPILT